ncbi:MAG: hypothetical protein LQ343_003875 [Gyalolechia ehrenbergii]|nr:MAG: hypothetical protein LQ343_003875 [Gyalolechia ehrenbergii]
MSVEHDSPRKLHPEAKNQDIQDLKRSKKRKRTTQEDINSPALKRKHHSKTYSHGVEASVISSKKVKSPKASSFHLQTSSLYLPLSPIAQNHPLEGLCAEHLSPLILTYHPPLRGTILSYQNARLSTAPQQALAQENTPVLAQAIDEYAAPHAWLTAEFLILRPQRGRVIEGWINLQNEGNIGLVCWNFFNASIERKRLPRDWTWIAGGLDTRRSKKKLKGSERDDDMELDQSESGAQTNGFSGSEGHFEDGDGRRIKGLLRFTVKDVDTSRSSGGDNGFLGIEGTLLDEAEERELREAEIRDEGSRAKKYRRKEQNIVYSMSGALVADGGSEVE